MKYTIMTYITGDYELLREIETKSPNARYVAVTDNPNLKSDTWEVVYDPELKGTPMANFLNIRWHPWKYTDTDIVVKVDGSVKPLAPIDDLIDKFEKDNCIQAFVVHPTRLNLLEEYDAWVRIRQYPFSQVQKCLKYLYSFEGYDYSQHRGMVEMTLHIQRRCKTTQAYNDMVWGLLEYLAPADCEVDRLDQTLASFVLQKYFAPVNIMYLREDWLYSKYFQWYAHGSDTPLIGMDVQNFVQPMMFDQPVTVITPEDKLTDDDGSGEKGTA